MPGFGRENAPVLQRRTGAFRRLVGLARHLHVLSFGALAAGTDIELDALTLLEALVAISLNSAEVDEYVGSAVLSDKAEALLGVEELHGTGCHVCAPIAVIGAGLRVNRAGRSVSASTDKCCHFVADQRRCGVERCWHRDMGKPAEEQKRRPTVGARFTAGAIAIRGARIFAMVHFDLTTTIRAPIGVVYDLSRSIELHLASMSSSGERAVGGVTTGHVDVGDTVTWRASHFGVQWRMTSRITVADRPHRFADEQLRGPFAAFHHEHRFTALDDQRTLMQDSITFRAPLGSLGRVVERSLLAAHMRQLIEDRNAFLRSEAESGRTRFLP